MTFTTPIMVAVATDIIERREADAGHMGDAARREFLARETEWPPEAIAELVATISDPKIAGIRLWYDRRLRLWVVQKIDRASNQIDDSDWYHSKAIARIEADVLANRHGVNVNPEWDV